MDPLEHKRVGNTDIYVSRLGLGTAGLGGHYGLIDEAQAIATVRKALQLGISYFDTAPQYGFGNAERILGKVLPTVPRQDFVISTKVGKVLDGFGGGEAIHYDFSREAVLRSLNDSLGRLGLDCIDIALVHDPDEHFDEAVGEALPALAHLREGGTVRGTGVGMNQWEMELRFAMEHEFDCFLLAGRYTLVNHSALGHFMSYCRKKGIGVVIGAPYYYGELFEDKPVFVSPRRRIGRLAKSFLRRKYGIPRRERIARIHGFCKRNSVPMKAVALQFPLAHPAVVSVIPGGRSPGEVEENFRMVQYRIPQTFWRQLKDANLIHPEAPVPE